MIKRIGASTKRGTILMLDDEPGTCSRLAEKLNQMGFVTLFPRTDEEARQIVSAGGADLVLHGSNAKSTFAKICGEIRRLDPQLPSLHISVEDSAAGHTHYEVGLHEKIRPLSPDRELKVVVGRLIRGRRLRLKVQAQERVFQILEKLDEATSPLDLRELEGRMVKFVGEVLGARDVVFISPTNLDFFINEFWKVRSLLEGAIHPLDENRQPPSLSGLSPEKLSEWLQDVAAANLGIWESRFLVQNLARIEGKGRTDLLPLVSGSRQILGYLLIADPTRQQPAATLQYMMRRMAKAMVKSLEHERSKSLSFVDDLTELYNQRYLAQVLDKEISRSQRNQAPFSVLFIDVDYFKKVNDMRGHLVGSKLLVQISKILQKNIRTVDYGFRYGGDEFLLLLSNTNSAAAKIVGERIREDVERHLFEVEGQQVKLTLSIGIASYPLHAKTREEIIHLADQAMYYGKNKSRNTVFVAS